MDTQFTLNRYPDSSLSLGHVPEVGNRMEVQFLEQEPTAHALLPSTLNQRTVWV